MLGSARELARTLLSFAETRTRLAAIELEEQAVRLTEILIWLAITLFFLGIAVIFVAILIVAVFWDTHRLFATGLLAAAFVGTGLFAALMARTRMRERPKFLAATLAELHRDKEQLG